MNKDKPKEQAIQENNNNDITGGAADPNKEQK